MSTKIYNMTPVALEIDYLLSEKKGLILYEIVDILRGKWGYRYLRLDLWPQQRSLLDIRAALSFLVESGKATFVNGEYFKNAHSSTNSQNK